MQAEDTGLLIIDEHTCKGCDWCVQACEHGGITINQDTGKAIACDLCKGEPKCKESCPEEALEIVDSDEAAEKRFNDALTKLQAQTELLTTAIKNKDWKPLIATAEKRSEKITEKLQALNKKTLEQKQKKQ
jgi:Fe-S-cluster-containing dehydrogenase component